MRIGFIGLGIMGWPMAANLLKAGFDVIGHNRGRAPVDRFVAAGGRGADSAAEAATGADVVITMLPDSPDVESVVLGGVLAAMSPGALLIDMSTIRPSTSIALAAAASEVGVRTLDAPVSGGEAGAVGGTLSIMVGGDADALADARPVLSALGTTIVHVGPHGAGQTVKAANQLLVAGTLGLVSEAIVLLEAAGVDPAAGLEVLNGGLAANRVMTLKGTAMLSRDFTPGFRVDLHHKDLGIGLSVAADAGVALPLGALAAQLIAATRARGAGSADHTAVLSVIESLSGRGAR